MTEADRWRVAIIDDYQDAALTVADWSALADRAEVRVFRDHLADPESIVDRLKDFDIVCVMRERTPLDRRILSRLPRLRVIASTGGVNVSIDQAAAAEHGVVVFNTGYFSAPTIELTWALILGAARHLPSELASVRAGGWQTHVGDDLAGSTLGLLGLGNIGSRVAEIGNAFGMRVIAWSEHLTSERAREFGAELVSKDEVLKRADTVSIHLVLSRRTRGLIGARELSLMKPTARIVNTSRGPIIDESALLAALESQTIAGAAIDVFDHEPLPADHPFRTLPTVLATPHIGYVSRNLYRRFFEDTVDNIRRWLDDHEGTEPRRPEAGSSPDRSGASA